MYDIFLDTIQFNKVSEVSLSSKRDISIYDSVGGDKFPIADKPGLKTWTIKFETQDHEVFDKLEKLLQRKLPSRLIIYSVAYQDSQRVLLESYTKPESEYAGVFKGSLSLVEYVEASVKTTDVPYVKRPGEAPKPEKVIVGSGTSGVGGAVVNSAYDAIRWEERDAWEKDRLEGVFIDPKTGKVINNPIMLKEGETYSYNFHESLERGKNQFGTYNKEDDLLKSWVDKTKEHMAKAMEEYRSQYAYTPISETEKKNS